MEQDLALNILKTGANVFLSGSAGTGKSYTLNQYIGHLKKNRVRYAITASTGIAASLLKGTTIHSWSGIGVREELSQNDLEKIKKRKSLFQTRRFFSLMKFQCFMQSNLKCLIRS